GPQVAVATEAVVTGVAVARAGLHHLAGAVAVVGPAGVVEPVGRGPLLVGVGRLEVGPLVTAAGDADPVERGENARGTFGAVPGGVGVFDTQHEHATVLLGVDPVLQRRPGAADMEHSRRGWGEPHAYRHALKSTAGAR